MKLDALGGAAAEPLRFMDSVVLFGPGVSVNVPAPERFAVHKLIVSTRRNGDAVGLAKSRKDLAQSAEILIALDQTSRGAALESAWREAWNRGQRWKLALKQGAVASAREAREVLARISGGDVDLDAG